MLTARDKKIQKSLGISANYSSTLKTGERAKWGKTKGPFRRTSLKWGKTANSSPDDGAFRISSGGEKI